jgi:ABC-type transport system involved in cytochrome bd biosynthesis fused ATPase/permease subunit
VSNGIDFVIGGKDQAKPAMSAVEKSLQRLEQKTESVGKSTQRLAAVTGTLTTVYVAVKAALAALGGLNRINAAYDAQTESVKKLNSALQIRGDADATSKMQDVAKSIEKMTGVSDNAASVGNGIRYGQDGRCSQGRYWTWRGNGQRRGVCYGRSEISP